MSKKEVRQAAAELTERLCEKDFLDRSGLSRKNVMMLMNKDHWEEQFARISRSKSGFPAGRSTRSVRNR